MSNEFIPYEQALALKELGFNEPCFGLWNINNGKYQVDVIGICKYSENFKYREVLAPTFSQAFRWFREKYGYDLTIKKCTPSEYKFLIEQLFVKGDNYYFIDFVFNTYEEAEFACLKKLIEIVKEKNLEN